MHKTLLVLSLLVVAAASRTLAGQLDVAVIMFPEEKTAEQLNASLAGVKLAEIADFDRTESSVKYLQAGYVKALVSIAVPRGGYFATSMRLGVFKSQLTGRLTENRVAATLITIEGMKGGIRSYLKGTYPVNGYLPTGQAVVLSIAGVHGKVTTFTKDNNVSTKKYFYTSAVIAQYTK